MEKLIIIGASGLGREVAWLVERINAAKPTWALLGFLDDNPEAQDTVVGGYPVLGNTSKAAFFKDAFFVLAVGAARTRRTILKKLESIAPLRYATLIDPSVLMSSRVKIGDGCVVCIQSTLTVDIEIGKHVIVNPACTIGHDAVIQDFVTLYPGVHMSGNTNLGECVEMGVGSQVIQKTRIGAETIVGAGAVVVKDLPANCVAVGCLAKPIKYLD